MDSTLKPPVQRIAPTEQPMVAPVKSGHIKVRLSYLTSDPKHIRSIMMRNNCGAKPPYTEDTCILMPRMKVFTDLQNYASAFERLQLSGVLPLSAKLTSYTILDEDDITLAYIVN